MSAITAWATGMFPPMTLSEFSGQKEKRDVSCDDTESKDNVGNTRAGN
jgi:hypothetical protein